MNIQLMRTNALKTTTDIPVAAAPVSSFAAVLDSVLEQIQTAGNECGYSQVLMLVTLRDWCDKQLQSHL